MLFRSIDAMTGSHLWADRYDGADEDIFSIQDGITESVIGCVAPELYAAEYERTKRKPPQSPPDGGGGDGPTGRGSVPKVPLVKA